MTIIGIISIVIAILLFLLSLNLLFRFVIGIMSHAEGWAFGFIFFLVHIIYRVVLGSLFLMSGTGCLRTNPSTLGRVIFTAAFTFLSVFGYFQLLGLRAPIRIYIIISVIFGIVLFYLTRSKVKRQFIKQSPENSEGE